jgi:hypothetical protein
MGAVLGGNGYGSYPLAEGDGLYPCGG